MKQLEVTPDLKKLDSVFSKNNYEIRVIGGAVRDLALEKEPKDIDLATDATPQEMQKMFDGAGIRHIPTGIEHGTITAVLNGEPYEITTLRADVETDGRRAEVEFIRSWEEDAKRRDLTYNAMSMDFEGNLYDYHGGMDDLQDKVTRFVGDPAERIKEDYLRTLRYFRFQGRLDTPTFDRETMSAIASNTDGLKQLSVERVWMEMGKILGGGNIKQILNAMQKAGVLDAIGLNYTPNNDVMDGGDPIINLARITDDESIGPRWKMSNEEKGKLGFLIQNKGKTHDKKWYTDQMVDGFDRTQLDALARYNNQDDMIQYIKTFKAPEFPVDGNDLIKLGHARGPGIGKTLMSLRNQWKAGNFKATKDDLLGEDQKFNELDYVLKKQVKPSQAVMLTKLGKFHNGADELEQFVPERKGKQYALHPNNWKGTYYSLTNKDTTKIGYYRPKVVAPPAGSIVADMAIANQFYRTNDEDEKQQLAQAYKDSMVEYGGDISHIKFPEILMPSVNENLQEDTKMPTVSLKDLFHVGTLDASKKGDFSYEGAGLSVTTEPDAWRRIARGQVAGDTHSVAKANNSFLDSHKLTPQHNEQIKQWAIDNGFLEQKETVTVSWYDDEMDDTLSQTFNSMADAEAEHGEYMDDYDVDVDKGGIVPTAKLQKATGQSRIEATGVLEYVLPLYAETLGLDGVWWADDLDVNRLSAPRGVIVPSKVDSFKFNRMNEAAGVGKITKQNTTVDVKPGETERQAKKYFGGTGKPKKLVSSSVMKNSTPNKLYNLGLAEDKEKIKGFDSKTVKAVNNLMIKFPHARDPLEAIIADMEDSQAISKAEDKHHKQRNIQQDKQLQDLTKRIEKLEQQSSEPVAEDEDMSVIQRAEQFAQQAHKDHKRKYTGDPYYVHLDEVRRIVKSAGGSENMQAAALLHDTVEDTSVTSQDIMKEFGPAIAKLVVELTDISKPEDGNRKVRKGIDRDKLAMSSADAQTIKYADLISNGRDIGVNDPKFAKVYHAEKADLLRVMRKGNKNLRNAAIDMLPNELRTIATENLSYTGSERRRLEKKKGIEVGTPEWFKHWFDLPYLREGDAITYDELVKKARSKYSLEYFLKGMMRTLHSLVTTGGNKHSIGYYAQEVGRQFGFNGRDLEKLYRKEYETPETGLYKRFSESTIQKVDIKQLETFADKLFGKVGIDVEFTKHFMDRVNDVRNQKPITMSELTRLFKQEYKRWGKPIAQMGPNAEAVMKDLQTDINLPFVLKWDSENDELDLVAKTVMRKADFKTPDREFPVENVPATNQPGTIGQRINWANKNKPQQTKKVATRGTQDPQSWWQSVLAKGKSLFDDEQMENFADGKKKDKSRPGRVKRAGASCKGSVTSLRKKAKNASGEKAKMYHWCANMKSGRKKTK